VCGAVVQEVEVTVGRLASIAWLFIWRGFVGALLIGAVVAGAVHLTATAFDMPGRHVARASLVGGLLVGLVWYFAVVRMALAKRYRDFRIALVAR
jgi:hypothetical protein